MRHPTTLLLAMLTIPISMLPAAVQAEESAAQTSMPGEDDQQAIARLKQAVSEQNNDFESWLLLGKAQTGQGQFDNAIDSFKTAIFLDPSLAEPHDLLAVIYTRTGNLPAANREHEIAMRLNPQPATAHEDAATPAPTAALPAAGKDTARKEVEDALEAWRLAWSSRDIDAYFRTYADGFDPGQRFPTVSAWRDYKRGVIGRQASIEVNIEGLEVVPLEDGLFRAEFRQYYRTPTYNSDDLEKIWLKRTEGGWKIIREVSG